MCLPKVEIVVSVVVLVVMMGGLQEVVAQEETMCRGVALNMTDKQKGMITECLTESKIKSVWKIPADKLSCFGVCILKKKELLTAEGKLDHDKIFSYVEMVMKPDEVKKPMKDGIEKCLKEHGDKVQVKDDTKCMTFLEAGQCVHDVFFELCMDDSRRRR
ncbi:uncharacterized protein LOC110853407 [Folsomia candida]|uniref:General odorant-binding protein 2 n=1 Tax=Folsomia candida TaxID=158441 RepID=A0A226E0B4_FOLCA|nr:uncharacterized protein LOC110853407 [Folsomia candida]OXA50983.1 General odorant-binding protein 2 [Folsomia candida]